MPVPRAQDFNRDPIIIVPPWPVFMQPWGHWCIAYDLYKIPIETVLPQGWSSNRSK